MYEEISSEFRGWWRMVETSQWSEVRGGFGRC